MIKIEFIDREEWNKSFMVFNSNCEGFKQVVEAIKQHDLLNKKRIKLGLRPIPIIN